MANRYWATGLTGGTSGKLDSIDPTDTDGSSTNLAVDDICDVVEEDMLSTYIARSSAGQSESSPDIILPDTNTSNWWWELIERVPQDEGIMTALAYNNTPGSF